MSSVSVSPDGRWLAFVATALPAGDNHLWLRAVGSSESVPQPGTDGANWVMWSPDGRAVAFTTGDKLKRLNVPGGQTQTVCDLPAGQASGGTWSSRNIIIFAVAQSLFRVAASGGEAGHHFLFYATAVAPGTTGIYTAALDNASAPVLVTAADSMPVYVSERLLFIREGVLLAAPLDAEARRLTGDGVPVAAGLQATAATGRAVVSASANLLAYRPGGDVDAEIAWFDRTGKPLGTTGAAGAFSGPRLSPDGTLLLIRRADPQNKRNDLWIIDLTTEMASRLTSEQSRTGDGLWAPDDACSNRRSDAPPWCPTSSTSRRTVSASCSCGRGAPSPARFPCR